MNCKYDPPVVRAIQINPDLRVLINWLECFQACYVYSTCHNKS